MAEFLGLDVVDVVLGAGDACDFRRVNVNADDREPGLGEFDGEGKTDVPEPNDTDPGSSSLDQCLESVQSRVPPGPAYRPSPALSAPLFNTSPPSSFSPEP